ncbi:paraquat-inducible protein A [Shewanella sp. JNE10-2]|uniref:paraquat-inducible protein A n=1 Tax=unclassified Shewanella TaxID=196818 RepID=UPI002006D6A8|nr:MULTISPECIES: paraquat-inducible protein A [unclassified Shewanella]MCK7630461.1 paraquat-inducible protein A [Shewanella sp. JNE9-1]MCK7634839.1 paraquat-inducible protein A [Shewanella sp. JNE17]MCK7645628.1 paraquat-inducible protein A [Shewanella sp. JNE3-1]MCK7650064.1 paraquat-inducible protein A [Shewanella sp. JNE8]MCK7653711.1 paraquat-inducible protein A [Shewanella sp. JNE4-1]
MKPLFSIFIILLSLALLVPGVTQPILSISGSIDKAKLAEQGIEQVTQRFDEDAGRDHARGMLNMVSSLLGLNSLKGEVEVLQKTRSIWGTVTELYTTGNRLVAALVMLFSVVIPALKLSLMLAQQCVSSIGLKLRVNALVNALAKWSMADVFVVALIITFMAGNASGGMGEMLKTQAQFENGFYFFTAYCILSILSGYLVRRPTPIL